MKFGRILFSVLLAFVAFGAAALGQAQKPDQKNSQYILGYQAGRRDERADLCHRFEKHSAIAATLLGDARMALIRVFCASRI